MAGLLRQIRQLNGLGDLAIAEPFAGGAGAALTLLYLEDTSNILINDADRAIHDFWWAVLNRSREFLRRIATVPVHVKEWHRQRAVYRSSAARHSQLARGFAAFYLNRCNRSGIITNGGPIGGIEQHGKWKIDARFNRDDLQERCERVFEYRNRISVTGLDGMAFIESMLADETFLFIDPPYFTKGNLLYLNAVDAGYHAELAAHLRSMGDSAAWVVTYNDCTEIRRMYDGWANIRPFSMAYVAHERRGGKEVLITPRWMQLPAEQGSATVAW